MNHTLTVEKLEAELMAATTTEEYDRIEAELREARKMFTIDQAKRAAEQREKAAAARAAAIERHQANRQALADAPKKMQALDEHIFTSLAQTFSLLKERYEFTQETRQLAARTNSEARDLGLPEPPPTIDPHSFADLSSVQKYAKDWIERYADNSSAAQIAGVKMTVDLLNVPSYSVAHTAKGQPKDGDDYRLRAKTSQVSNSG